MYTFDRPAGQPRCIGLMHTIVQEVPLVRVSTAAWYPFGIEFRPCYETWIFSDSPLLKSHQKCYESRDIAFMVKTHAQMVRSVRRHLSCQGDKQAACELKAKEDAEYHERKRRYRMCEKKKAKYQTMGEALAAKRLLIGSGILHPKKAHAYKCDYCPDYHVGGGFKK